MQTSPQKLAVLAALLAFGPGCLAPVLHQVEIAEMGQVAGGLSAQVTALGVQAEAQAAVGVLPHLQIEGSGTAGAAGWAASAGARGQFPIFGDALSVQIAGSYGYQLLNDPTQWCTSDRGCQSSPVGTTVNAAKVEIGAVGRVGSTPRAPSWGAWVAEAGGTQSWSGSSHYDETDLTTSLEVPFNTTRTFSLLLGLTARLGSAIQNTTSTTQNTVGGGCGVVARF